MQVYGSFINASVSATQQLEPHAVLLALAPLFPNFLHFYTCKNNSYLLIILVSPPKTYFNPWKVVSFVNSDTFSFKDILDLKLTVKNHTIQMFSVNIAGKV